jgi:hypothetical protein
MTTLHRRRLVIALAIMAGIGIFAAANMHLIWTSVSSQPECVPHLKAPGQDGQFRAAQPSC